MANGPTARPALERRASRQAMVANAAFTLSERTGSLTDRQLLNEMLVVALSSQAECRGVWAALMAKGIITEAQRQDFLDAGYMDLMKQIQGQSIKVGANGG